VYTLTGLEEMGPDGCPEGDAGEGGGGQDLTHGDRKERSVVRQRRDHAENHGGLSGSQTKQIKKREEVRSRGKGKDLEGGEEVEDAAHCSWWGTEPISVPYPGRPGEKTGGINLKLKKKIKHRSEGGLKLRKLSNVSKNFPS